ncbi:DUF397 domain-containing protein [Microbispora sp. H10836]|uniref:DUF397 domain-containing protein n=1 Tax=Microbispora sp. H10836 TaxID=2729106 RepID=UPI0014737B5F|nr:DUF397 domain-containing protein [Microbispora sp. H10836]
MNTPTPYGLWRRSSKCNNGTCVEVAAGPNEVRIRDSKDPEGPQLRVKPKEWRSFLAEVKAGAHDVPPHRLR